MTSLESLPYGLLYLLPPGEVVEYERESHTVVRCPRECRRLRHTIIVLRNEETGEEVSLTRHDLPQLSDWSADHSLAEESVGVVPYTLAMRAEISWRFDRHSVIVR